MAYKAHRNGDSRACGASTIVVGQSTVYVNGALWAVDNDPNSHGAGNLDANDTETVIINGKPVVTHTPDPGHVSDNLTHTPSAVRTAQGSPDVFAYGGSSSAFSGGAFSGGAFST